MEIESAMRELPAAYLPTLVFHSSMHREAADEVAPSVLGLGPRAVACLLRANDLRQPWFQQREDDAVFRAGPVLNNHILAVRGDHMRAFHDPLEVSLSQHDGRGIAAVLV
jgi:hypothetical protein